MTTTNDVIGIGAIKDSMQYEDPVEFDGVRLFFRPNTEGVISVFSERGEPLCSLDDRWTDIVVTSQIRGSIIHHKVLHPVGAITVTDAKKKYSTVRDLGRFPGWKFFTLKKGAIISIKDNYNNARRNYPKSVEIVALSPEGKSYRIVSRAEAEQLAIDEAEASIEKGRAFEWEMYESLGEGA